MWSKLIQFFEPPQNAGDETAHRKWLLHFILCFFVAIVTIIGIALAITVPEYRWRWFVVIAVVDLPCLGLIALNRYDRTLLASVLLVTQFWLVPTAFAFSANGIHAPAIIAYVIVPFISGQLLGPRPGFVSGFICWLTILGFAFLEQNGWLPAPSIHYRPYSFWLVQGMYLAFFTCLQWVVGKGMTGALRRAQNELSERKRTEANLQESEERYRIVIKLTGQLVYDYDVASGKIIWRGAITELTGFTPEEFQELGIHAWENLIHPEDRPKALADREVSQKAVSHCHAQYRFRCQNGSYIFIEDYGAFLPDNSGQAHRMLGTMSDITARKRAEMENLELTQTLERRVQERTVELEVANKELEAFSFSASHDLRAPLRYIGGFATMLSEDHGEEFTGESLDLIKRIKISATRMEQLIDALLEFSRMSRASLNKESLDMTALAQAVIKEWHEEHPPRQIVIEVSPLPPSFGDQKLVKQVLCNLIGNAIKFTPPSPQAKIEIGATNNGELIYFVKDNGVGFEMKTAGKLFQAFQRLHRQDQFEGSGIGLSIVHRIIQRHGGRIWAEAAKDKGATFFFTLPASTPEK